MNIPEEAIEKAAMASVNYQARNGDSLPWDALAKFWRDYYREQARAALSAAAPYLMAMALRDAARDLSWFGAQGNTVEPNTAWAGVTACMNALNNIADELEQL